MSTRTRTLVRASLVTLVVIAATFGLDPFRNFQLATAAAVFAAVAGLTVLVGLTGQLSLGHAVLMAAGGYGYAIASSSVVAMTSDDGAAAVTGSGASPGAAGTLLPFLAGLAGAVVVAGVLGLLLGLAAARLRGPYLAGLTLALVIALSSAASVIGPLGGDQGRAAPFLPVPGALAALIAVEQWHAWIAVTLAACAVTPLLILRAGRAGLRMRAVHDDETAARLAGIDPGRVKAGAFTASALSAGTGGAALAIVTQNVSPGAYGLGFSLLLVVAAVVGGLGSLGGAAIGSVLVVTLPWAADQLAGTLPADLTARLDGNLALLLFGVVVIAVTLAAPGGLARFLPRSRHA
ncbi:branched-chain amino acid ABC transporter permease [Myceligenerans crystallogenes]|uniref:Branched-chain amino acid ABC transporter permease n=1 Tax=Myceligenerans crystallogenes TaxID=316335 RepID=A0ABP4ZF89_9MICO